MPLLLLAERPTETLLLLIGGCKDRLLAAAFAEEAEILDGATPWLLVTEEAAIEDWAPNGEVSLLPPPQAEAKAARQRERMSGEWLRCNRFGI